MARWLWWAPLAFFMLFWAVIGLRYGLLAVTTTETDVINRYAERYVAAYGDGAKLTDCAAWPEQEIPGVWLVIVCSPQGAAKSFDYYVNRLGGLEFGDQTKVPRIEGPRA